MHTFKYLTAMFCAFLVLLSPALLAEPHSKSSPWAKVFIIEPKDGQSLTSPVKVKFGIKGMTLMPAGVAHPESGHHHLLVDAKDLPDLSKPIPADKHHIHFGKAQKETVLELPPGEHTLQLLLGDHLHHPHDKPVFSEKITIKITEKKADKKTKPD